MRATSLVFGSAAALWLGACEVKKSAPVVAATPAAVEPRPLEARPAKGPTSDAQVAAAEPIPSPPVAHTEITIPAGAVQLGSETGSPLRNPAHEADHVGVALTAFAIDAYPYPNDPAKAPKSSVTRDEARALCAEQGKRLCSELEWERACKGERAAEYPAPAFDAQRCVEQPASCGSPFGVFALGTLGREWTSSDAAPGEWDGRSAVVRGAARDAPAAAHRCAARDAATPRSRSESLLFRCCRGPEQRATYPAPSEYPAFVDGAPEPKVLARALASMPETKGLAGSFRPYRQAELGQALTQAGRSQSSLAPWQAIAGSLTWSPVRGEQIVVVSGDTPDGAAVLAYYPVGPEEFRFAGSYVTKGEHTPILVAYKADVRDELLFSTCWGCGGEGGALRLDESARLRFLPR